MLLLSQEYFTKYYKYTILEGSFNIPDDFLIVRQGKGIFSTQKPSFYIAVGGLTTNSEPFFSLLKWSFNSDAEKYLSESAYKQLKMMFLHINLSEHTEDKTKFYSITHKVPYGRQEAILMPDFDISGKPVRQLITANAAVFKNNDLGSLTTPVSIFSIMEDPNIKSFIGRFLISRIMQKHNYEKGLPVFNYKEDFNFPIRLPSETNFSVSKVVSVYQKSKELSTTSKNVIYQEDLLRYTVSEHEKFVVKEYFRKHLSGGLDSSKSLTALDTISQIINENN